MRLTRESLIKMARDLANQRVRISRRIICIYLTGSILEEEALLGGTTDIDLIIVHDSEPLRNREIVRISDDVHLDIGHYEQAVFHQPRHLRTDPWLGPFIYNKPMVLHDTQHWFEFTQASTGAQFTQPDYIYQRALKLAEAARQSWMDMQLNPSENYSQQLWRYLQTLEDAGNAVASLSGIPLTERRFFMEFPTRANIVEHPDLFTGLVGLLTDTDNPFATHWEEWEPAWLSAFQAAGKQEDAPARLNANRLGYYSRAASALKHDHPMAALWMALRTWTLAVKTLPIDGFDSSTWQNAIQALRLDEPHFADRLSELDKYLDNVEECLEQWGRDNGVSMLEE